jgi:hypothetical protein
LVGCSNLSPTGADSSAQQEISPESAGKLAVASLGESQNAASMALSADSAASMLANAGIPATAALSKSLAKTAAAARTQAQTVEFDTSRIDEGVAAVIFHTDNLLFAQHDTILIKWDAFARDTIEDNETVIAVSGGKSYANGKQEWYSVVDLDGDGVLNPAQGGDNSATVTAVTRFAGVRSGQVETLVLRVDAGPDGDFDAEEDNRIVGEASWVRMGGGDTLAYARYADADGDGVLFVEGSESALDVVWFQKDPGVFVAWHTLRFRLITNGNEAEDVIVKLYGEEERRSGRTSCLVILDENGDSVISEGDMAHATWSTLYSPDRDSIISASIACVYDPQSGIQNERDNLYHELSMEEQKRFGFVRERSFSFTTDTPVPDGQEPESGHISMQVTYFNGKSISLEADFTTGSFSGTYTGPDGETLDVAWNENGEVIADSK